MLSSRSSTSSKQSSWDVRFSDFFHRLTFWSIVETLFLKPTVETLGEVIMGVYFISDAFMKLADV